MKRGLTALILGAALVTATPAAGQMWFFPDYAVPSMTGQPTTWVSGSYGRGLNDDSGETDGFAAVIGRTGESASFMGGIGLVTSDGDDEVTLGAAVGVDVMRREAYTLSVQGGFGWMSFEILDETVTTLRFPVGLALKGDLSQENSTTRITPWVMPRLNIARISGFGDSDTETDLGLSGGVTFTFENGFGVHTALDYLSASGGDPIYFGIGVHYLLGQR
ncbi:MAG TPA: hypothetical protein VLA43_19560 [Longimicrobiales bacterium]|nr:hypothetical protein [Longimicrobiales bacterium]